jgi:hypothetical protein
MYMRSIRHKELSATYVITAASIFVKKMTMHFDQGYEKNLHGDG